MAPINEKQQDKLREAQFRWLSGIVCVLVGSGIGVSWYVASSSVLEDRRARAIAVAISLVACLVLQLTALIVYKRRRTTPQLSKDENPYRAPQSGLQSTFTLTCCRCWKQFEIQGEQAERTRAFYAAQPNHTADKEVGICDECWPKCQKPDDSAPQS
jgi:hypothetical protein